MQLFVYNFLAWRVTSLPEMQISAHETRREGEIGVEIGRRIEVESSRVESAARGSTHAFHSINFINVNHRNVLATRRESRVDSTRPWPIVMEERNVIASIVRAIKQVRALATKLGNGV